MTTALVLAGGPPDDVSALQPHLANKAFFRIDGVSLVERTLRGLRSSDRIGKLIVVAPPQTHPDPALALADECRPDGARITESLASGLTELAADETVIVTAADLPVLHAGAVDDFVARVLARNVDLAYGCVDRRVHIGPYAEIRHTWARLRDGTFCGAGLAAIRPRAFPALARFMEQLGRARKNPLALATLFGWDITLRFALRLLTIAQTEARAQKLLQVSAGAIISPYPEIAVNVDRPSDIAIAERLVGAISP